MKIFNSFNISMFFVALCFGLTSKANYGLFMVVKGDVKVQKTDNQTIPAKVGLKVAVGDMIISAVDSRAKIVMSDRNVINISPLTKLKIEKYTIGADKNVELSLTEGKVRSDVEQEYDGEKTKYLIKTPTAVAGVRGTQFITSFDSKTNVTEVVTLRGQVSFSSLTTAASVMVNKGEGSLMKKDQAPEKPKLISAETLKSMDHESGGKESEGKGAKDSKDGKGTSGAVDNRDAGPGNDGPKPPAPTVSGPTSGVNCPGGVCPPPPPPTPKNVPLKTKVKVIPQSP